MKYNRSLRWCLPFLSGLLMCSVLLAGCGGSAASGSGTTSSGCGTPPKLAKKDHYTVGFSQNASNNPWRLAETASIKAEAAKRGDQLVLADANNSGDKQVADVQSMIAQKVDVILLAPITEKALVPAVLAARQACIPVILIDRDVDHTLAKPNQDYVTFIGSDFVQQGKRVADWLIQNTGGTAKIIELEGTTGASPAINRKKGFDDEIKTAPGMQILASQDGDFNRDTGRKVMETLLQAHPDVTAVYAHNDEMAIGAIAALKAAGKKPGKDVTVVSIDGEKDALNAIIAGEEGTSVQSSPFFGPISFQTIDQYASGQKLPDWIVVQDMQFTKDNAAQNLANSF
ncbi:MAG TPA: ABC transporter substrate-binding protein [Ktedonosporobacter sp.]|nr:ABC transporter substrate-binding protein [Ktedonosporobacter sp.]